MSEDIWSNKDKGLGSFNRLLGPFNFTYVNPKKRPPSLERRTPNRAVEYSKYSK